MLSIQLLLLFLSTTLTLSSFGLEIQRTINREPKGHRAQASRDYFIHTYIICNTGGLKYFSVYNLSK